MGSPGALPAVSERERMMLATAELWSEVGYEGLSVEGICERAEIAVETFTAEFGEVRGAARATLEATFAAVVGLVAEKYGSDRSEPESCALGIVAILEFMAANPAYAYVIYIGRRQRVPAELRELSKNAQRFIVAMLDRLRESSASYGQPPMAGAGALGGPEAVIRREILAGRTELLGTLAADVVYGALVPFVGQTEALRLARLGGDRDL